MDSMEAEVTCLMDAKADVSSKVASPEKKGPGPRWIGEILVETGKRTREEAGDLDRRRKQSK